MKHLYTKNSKDTQRPPAVIAIMLAVVVNIGCGLVTGPDNEESGTKYLLDETCHIVRNGVRLILAFDAKSSSFKGTIENTTSQTLNLVRIEVHLSNGTELGPTTPADFAPSEKREVTLSAEGQSFEWWKAHAEAGASEH